MKFHEEAHQMDVREALKKKYGIIWEFFPNVGPPPPPFGNASFKMKYFG